MIDTLQQDFDVPINHYVEVNFKTFEDIVNAVGSVPVFFPYDARDQLSGLGIGPFPGCHQLDGPQALAYVRSRYLEYFIDGTVAERQPAGRHRPHPAPAGVHQDARAASRCSARSTTRPSRPISPTR